MKMHLFIHENALHQKSLALLISFSPEDRVGHKFRLPVAQGRWGVARSPGQAQLCQPECHKEAEVGLHAESGLSNFAVKSTRRKGLSEGLEMSQCRGGAASCSESCPLCSHSRSAIPLGVARSSLTLSETQLLHLFSEKCTHHG